MQSNSRGTLSLPTPRVENWPKLCRGLKKAYKNLKLAYKNLKWAYKNLKLVHRNLKLYYNHSILRVKKLANKTSKWPTKKCGHNQSI